MACHLRCLVVLWFALPLLMMEVVRGADAEQWLTYPGKSGPGRGKRVV